MLGWRLQVGGSGITRYRVSFPMIIFGRTALCDFYTGDQWVFTKYPFQVLLHLLQFRIWTDFIYPVAPSRDGSS